MGAGDNITIGKFSTGGWFGYPPYTEASFSPGEGPDYWIWALTLASLASTLTGINFAVTIYKERAPGMKLMYMPLFTWTALCTSIIMIFAMPPLTVATAQLALDLEAVALHPFPHLIQEGFAADVMPIDAPGFQIALDHELAGDARVVAAGHPQARIAEHAVPADHDVFQGHKQGVAVVQAARHVGRGHGYDK